MANVHIKVDGLDKIVEKIGSLPKTVKKEVDTELSSVANNYVNRAVADAPVDQGVLKGQITAKRNGLMDYEIVSGARWSAYIEFGTKRRFKAIPGIDSSKYKQLSGAGGGVRELFQNILEWVKRKGIASRFSVKTRKKLKHTKADDVRALEAAAAITISILRHGIRPHPFFFKQLPIAQKELTQGMNEVLKRALEK